MAWAKLAHDSARWVISRASAGAPASNCATVQAAPAPPLDRLIVHGLFQVVGDGPVAEHPVPGTFGCLGIAQSLGYFPAPPGAFGLDVGSQHQRKPGGLVSASSGQDRRRQPRWRPAYTQSVLSIIVSFFALILHYTIYSPLFGS
jgi:hypothetical protein